MVRRYTLDMGTSWTKFVDDNGEYVTYADYEKLQKENEELKVLLHGEKECPSQCEHLKGDYCLLSVNHCIYRAEDYSTFKEQGGESK